MKLAPLLCLIFLWWLARVAQDRLEFFPRKATYHAAPLHSFPNSSH
jgi:hypothetical protein